MRKLGRQLSGVIAIGWFVLTSTAVGQSASQKAPVFQELVDQVVDIQVKNNPLVANAKVILLKEGKLDNSIRFIKVQPATSKRYAQFSASKITEIFVEGQPLDVTYDKKNRCLVHSIEKRLDRLEHRKIVERRLAKNRDKLWEYLTPDLHEAFLKKHFKFLEKTESALPDISFRLVETNYFLFFTDLGPEEVDGYIAYLDAMYRELCMAFGLSPDKNIWCGKCVVIAFREKSDFLQFEAKVMNNSKAEGAQGLCHQSYDGTVVFSGFKGTNGFFGHVLVHETAHGFVHRYLSTARAPSWLNEGMSDWLAHQIVGGKQIPRRQQNSARRIIADGGWGDFLTTPKISYGTYGSASTLVEILLDRDKGGQFKQFFDGIKEGKHAEESLKDAFQISYQDLEALYSQIAPALAN